MVVEALGKCPGPLCVYGDKMFDDLIRKLLASLPHGSDIHAQQHPRWIGGRHYLDIEVPGLPRWRIPLMTDSPYSSYEVITKQIEEGFTDFEIELKGRGWSQHSGIWLSPAEMNRIVQAEEARAYITAMQLEAAQLAYFSGHLPVRMGPVTTRRWKAIPLASEPQARVTPEDAFANKLMEAARGRHA